MSDAESDARGRGTPDAARDTRDMVPPPTTDAIDALIDAVSAGGAPVAPSSRGGRSGRGLVHRSSSRWPALRALDAAMLRVIVPSLVAFALGAFVAVWALHVLDPTPRPVARAAPPPDAPATTQAGQMGAAVASAPLVAASRDARADAAVPTRGVPSTTSPPPPPPPPAAIARAEPPTVSGSLPAVSRLASPTIAPRGGSVGRQPTAPTAIVAARAAERRTSDRAGTEPNRVIASSPHAEPPASFATSPLAATALSLPESAVSAPLSVPTATAAGEVARAAADERAVLRTVGRYRTALAQLNAADAAAVWPSVDRVALGRAFASLRSQGLEFENCEVQLDRLSATARCRGVAEYVQKIGSATSRRGRYEWTFSMRRTGPDWTIEQVTTARLGTGPSEASTSNR